MNQLVKNIIIMIFLISNLHSVENCLSKYNCQLDINGTKIIGIKNCRLSNMDTFPIIAKDVFNLDEDGKPAGTLKTYFGTGETVCNILGWMNDGAGKFDTV